MPRSDCRPAGFSGWPPRGVGAFLPTVQAFFTLLILLVVLAPIPAWAQGRVPVPELTGRVVDLTGILPQDRKQQLEERLRAFEESKGAQVAVLIVPSTSPEAIEQYSIRVAEAWKLGREKADDGAILLVALKDRAMRIEVGYGLEGALTDLVSKRIIGDIITPHFREGDMAGGIEAGTDAMLKVIEGEALPPPNPAAGRGEGRGGGLAGSLPFLLILLFAAGSVARAIFGRFLGGFLGGGAAGVFGWILTGSLFLGLLIALAGFILILLGLIGGGRRGGFYRGGRGGFFGGMGGGGFRGGGGFGGFSGGGGGFGGGGASGRW